MDEGIWKKEDSKHYMYIRDNSIVGTVTEGRQGYCWVANGCWEEWEDTPLGIHTKIKVAQRAIENWYQAELQNRKFTDSGITGPKDPTSSLEQKASLKIYDLLREAHNSIKTIQDNFDLSDWPDQENAVEAVANVLYMAETIVVARMDK